MIKRVRVQGYKLLRDVDVPLERLTVIVGRNGVGKSTLLEAIGDVGASVRAVDAHRNARAPAGPCAVFDGAHSLERIGARPPCERFELAVELEDGPRVSIKPMRDPRGGDQDKFEVSLVADGERSNVVFPNLLDTWGQSAALLRRARALGFGLEATLSLDSTALSKPSHSESERPRLGRTGAELAVVLQYLLSTRDPKIADIERDLAAVIPDAIGLKALPARVRILEEVEVSVGGATSTVERTREVTGSRFEVHWKGVGWVPADQLSEGTLFTIGLLTAIRDLEATTLLVDDVDKGLHPVAQARLVHTLRSILASHPGIQIIATSHSPFVLDALEPESVVIAGTGDDGGARFMPLVSHPSWQKRQGYMRPGEFWSVIGEDWVGSAAP